MSNKPLEFKNKAIILGVKIDDLTEKTFFAKIDDFLRSEKPHLIFTPNPEICLKASYDSQYRHILNSAEINLPDGFGLKLGAKILKETLRNRLTGADMTKKLLQKYARENLKTYIVLKNNSLTTPHDLEKLYKRDYGSWQIKIKNLLDNEMEILNEINQFEPQIVFVCLGAPQQEYFSSKIAKYCPKTKIIMAIGGSFDFLTQKIKRAPRIIRELGMEWLFRLYQEPKRLNRIKNATIDFLLRVHQWDKRMKNEYRENVVGLIFNTNGEVLIQKSRRFINHWQFPQGGVAKNENFESAIIREINEELGIAEKFLKIIRKIPESKAYITPRYAQLLQGYKGQKQTAYVIAFIGQFSDIHADGEEVQEAKFIPLNEVENILHKDRQIFWQVIKKYL